MKLKDYAKREAAVLDWVNEIRKQRGHTAKFTLPAGVCGSRYSCPVALALGTVHTFAQWHSSWVTASSYGAGGSVYGILPNHVAAFVHDFDEGEFPWLVGE